MQKDGRGYPPLINALSNTGKKSVIAIRVVDKDGEGGMHAWALEGSEPLYSLPLVSFASDKVTVAPGGSSKIKLTVSNPFNSPLDAAALLVSPIETWPGGGRYSLVQTGPAVKNISIDANGKKDIEFEVSAPPDSLPGPYWAMVKLVYAGQTSYSQPVDIIVK